MASYLMSKCASAREGDRVVTRKCGDNWSEGFFVPAVGGEIRIEAYRSVVGEGDFSLPNGMQFRAVSCHGPYAVETAVGDTHGSHAYYVRVA